MSNTILTQEGVRRLNRELEWVKSEKLPQAEGRFKDAKLYGYVKGDFEFDDSKEQRDFYKKRIGVLENMLSTAKVISNGNS